MQFTNSVYRKNVWLISAFLITITVTLIVGLVLSYRFTAGNVTNDFNSKKNDILEKTTEAYAEFFNDRIPRITTYVGYMDSSKAAVYAGTIFNDFPFVTRIVFYKIGIGNPVATAQGEIGYVANGIYQFTLDEDVLVTTMRSGKAEMGDLQVMMDKLKRYVANADTTRDPNDTEKFNTFYDSKPNKISYLNIPRRTDIKNYRDIQSSGRASLLAAQDMMTFFLDPTQLKIVNNHPELYQSITVKQVVYDPLDNSSDQLSTDAPFPGALSDYKLYFKSDKNYLSKEARRQFMPIAGVILLVYLFLVLIGWLIFRNLAVNLKLFKLQYDFINNFTHEFKTPVSVIKIAGSNIRGEADLTERQRKHYGKILDEEADKLNDLMNKLLSFTQIENRSIKIKVEEIDVDEFVTKYINTFKIKYPDMDLKCKIAKGVNTFFTDPVLLGSIFQNLIENAYKYSNPERKEVLISILLEKRNIVFSFADKGIGIPKAELANVFKKFYRIENKYNQNGSVGLGLAFVKELVNFMDGQITVKSKVNEGSEFVVSLPYEN